MKFKNISIYAIHNKATTLNGQKLQRAITPTPFDLIGSKFNLTRDLLLSTKQCTKYQGSSPNTF